MLDKEDELLNSKQVATILDMSPDTVNEFARKNILPAFKKGKQCVFGDETSRFSTASSQKIFVMLNLRRR